MREDERPLLAWAVIVREPGRGKPLSEQGYPAQAMEKRRAAALRECPPRAGRCGRRGFVFRGSIEPFRSRKKCLRPE